MMKKKTPTSHKKRKGLYDNFNAVFKINTMCVFVGINCKQSCVQGRVMEIMEEITKQGEETEK